MPNSPQTSYHKRQFADMAQSQPKKQWFVPASNCLKAQKVYVSIMEHLKNAEVQHQCLRTRLFKMIMSFPVEPRLHPLNVFQRPSGDYCYE